MLYLGLARAVQTGRPWARPVVLVLSGLGIAVAVVGLVVSGAEAIGGLAWPIALRGPAEHRLGPRVVPDRTDEPARVSGRHASRRVVPGRLRPRGLSAANPAVLASAITTDADQAVANLLARAA